MEHGAGVMTDLLDMSQIAAREDEHASASRWFRSFSTFEADVKHSCSWCLNSG